MVTRNPGHIFADEIVTGVLIIPPGKVHPVEVIYQMDPRGDVFEFACTSPQGWSALRLHRSEQVEAVSR